MIGGTITGFTYTTYWNYKSFNDTHYHDSVEHIHLMRDSLLMGLIFGSVIGGTCGLIVGLTSPFSIPYFTYDTIQYLKRKKKEDI